jgi:flagellar biosynthetic protein FliQ
MDFLLEHVRKGIMLSLMISMPLVLAAAAVGLLVGILQAVTQVQEQTISAVPKLIIVFVMLIAGGSLMMQMLGGYIRESMILAFQTVPRAGARVLPPAPSRFIKQQLAPGQFRLRWVVPEALRYPLP